MKSNLKKVWIAKYASLDCLPDWQCTASTKDDAIEHVASMLDNPWGIKTALRRHEHWDEPGEHNLYYAAVRVEHLTQEEIDAIDETC